MFRRYIEATAGTGAIALALVLALSTATGGAVIPTADLEFWVRADAGVTKDGSNYVTSWADQTPGSTEFAGPDGTQPVWVAGALGGQPVIRFDGNDRLWNNRFATGNPIQGNEVTAFMVANRSAVSVNTSAATFIQNGQARDYNNTPSFVMAYESPGGTTLMTYRNGGLSTASHPGNASPYVFATSFDGVSNTAFLNGAPQGAVASSGAFDVDHIVIGQRYDLGFSDGYVGDIAELIVYERALSTAERNQVGAYLSDKYGLGGVHNPGVRNGQFENVTGGGTYPQAAEWDGSCPTAQHAALPYGNNGPLGDRFAFTLPSNADASQTIGTPFAPDTKYVFKGFGVDNNVNNENDIAFRIGYLDGSNVFQESASQTYDLTGLTSWTELDGVTYTTGASGPELGQLITLRVGAVNVDYVNGGVFFDQVSLAAEAAPPPPPPPSLPVTNGRVQHLDAAQIDPDDPNQVQGGLVGQWNDSSPKANHASQTNYDSNERRPQYISDGGAAFNNQPVVRFDGALTFLDASSEPWSNLGHDFDGLLNESQATVFAVLQTNSPTANQLAVDGTGAHFPRVQVAGGNWYAGTNNNAYGFGSTAVTTAPTIYASIFDGMQAVPADRLLMAINGVDQTLSLTGIPLTDTGSVTRMLTGIWASGQYVWDGDIAEIIIYDRLLSPAEQNAMGFYLQEKYGIDGAYTRPLAEIPEPVTMAMVGLGMMVLGRYTRRRRR